MRRGDAVFALLPCTAREALPLHVLLSSGMAAPVGLGGVSGYRKVARLVARAFYSGPCPPPEEPAADALEEPKPKRRKTAQVCSA